MNISQRIDQRQAQTLVMTPQLQQAIKLLQMSNMELGEFVAQEIERNPLLDSGDGTAETAPDAPVETRDDSTPVGASDGEPADLSGKTDDGWDGAAEVGDDRFEESYRTADTGGSFDGDDYDAAQNVAEKPSLRDHLTRQIQVDFTDPADRMIASALTELLDEAGYLPADLGLVRTQLGIDVARFEGVIGRLQSFDPCGIYARSLKECLAIQLKERDRLDPAMAALLDRLDLLAKRDMAGLMRHCGVDAEDLTAMIAEIRRLDPKPAAAFTADVAQPIVPDVMLRPLPAKDGAALWHVELNTDTLPRVLANDRYYKQVQAAASSKADKDYITDRWQQANWLVKALHQRATTILKVASEIVREQDAFFVHGVSHLKPLVLKDIAALVDMHESTISRVTQNKYITTPRGLFELKYFFTTGLARSDGGNDMSSEAVRARIKAMIDAEKPTAILSDDHLAMMLRGEGIDVARRTVAKYREALRIPTSAQRRRDKRL